MRAEIRQNEEGQLRADLENGTSIFGTTAKLDAFAVALFDAGVRHGEAMCGDWREPGSVMGHAVRLNHVLSWLGQGRGMPPPLPSFDDEDSGPAPTHEELMSKISYRTEYAFEQRIAARRKALLAEDLPEEEPPQLE